MEEVVTRLTHHSVWWNLRPAAQAPLKKRGTCAMSCNSALALGLSQEDVLALVESWNFTTDDGGHLFRTNRCGQPSMLTKINVRGAKHQVSVRHTLWEMKHGRVAQGKRLVGCPDNPKCVNPEHQTLLRKQDPKERFMRFVENNPERVVAGCGSVTLAPVTMAPLMVTSLQREARTNRLTASHTKRS